MKVLVLDSPEAVAQAAADLVADLIRDKPDATLIAATGNTPMGLYRELAHRHSQGSFDTRLMHVYQLDEYLDISGPEDDRSLCRWMKESFLDPLDITPDRTVLLPGADCDLDAACKEFDRKLERAGGLDLAILGLGPNGHLGFNEPPSHPDAGTRVVTLTDQTIESNAAYWGSTESVPRRAVTVGMRQLLAARQVLLLAMGEHKAEIVRRTLKEPENPGVPGSCLQHVDGATILLDREAAMFVQAPA